VVRRFFKEHVYVGNGIYLFSKDKDANNMNGYEYIAQMVAFNMHKFKICAPCTTLDQRLDFAAPL
jgi:hypothetical protein